MYYCLPLSPGQVPSLVNSFLAQTMVWSNVLLKFFSCLAKILNRSQVFLLLLWPMIRKIEINWTDSKVESRFKKVRLNTSYLTDSYISFTLNLESGQKFCSNRSIRSSTYGKKNISDFPPCGKLVIFVNEFVIFLKTSK